MNPVVSPSESLGLLKTQLTIYYLASPPKTHFDILRVCPVLYMSVGCRRKHPGKLPPKAIMLVRKLSQWTTPTKRA